MISSIGHFIWLTPISQIVVVVQWPASIIAKFSLISYTSQEPLPPKFVKARRDIPQLMDFIDAVALYHFSDRMIIEDEYPQKLLVAPVDAWHGFKIFGENLIMSALNLRELDKKILQFMRARPNQKWSAIESQSKMQEPEYGENRGISEIRTALEDMIEKLYVQRQDGPPVEYTASSFGQSINVADQAKLDWSHVVEKTKEKARENLTEAQAEEYISNYCEGDGLIATHPITGETVNILEDTEFEDALEDAQEAVDEEMEESLWAGPSDDPAEGSSSEPEAVSDGGEATGTL